MTNPEDWDDLRPEVQELALAVEARLRDQERGQDGERRSPQSYAVDGLEGVSALLRSLTLKTRYPPSALVRDTAVCVAIAMLHVIRTYGKHEDADPASSA